MANMWHKHPLRLLLYLEWVLLGIALLAAFSVLIPHPRHHGIHPPGFNLIGIFCIAVLGIMGLRLPVNSKHDFIRQIYIAGGLLFSWLAIAFIGRGERVFPALLLVVVIRACLLFSWGGRIFIAVIAYGSFLALQIMALMRISFLGVPIGRLPSILRRLPPDELRRVWFGIAFNSSLLFALVLIFVLLLVGAVLAEHESRAKLILAHRRLREYALQAEDRATLQERNRLAREIHDSVGHYLTAQSIQLENTALFLAEDPTKAASYLAKARQLGKEALANIRFSVATLRKNPMQERSPTASFEQLISNFKSNTNLKVVYKINLASLSNEVSLSLFRIAQEALTNITKHSQATQVILDLESTEKQVLLSIQDNGCGFNRDRNTTGFGLQGMQERAAALGGKMAIASKPQQGCRISVEIPLFLSNY